MEILTELQRDLIKALGKTEIKKFFYLTGGSALSAFYLKHRYSDDLDFFTPEEERMQTVRETLLKVSQRLDVAVEISREFRTFFEGFIQKGQERIKLHFAEDSPYRLEPTVYNEALGFFHDNQLDIACNKLSALFDRHDIKDFVDIYFLSKEFMDFWKIYENAKKKHIGMEEYWLAVSLDYIYSMDKLPRMIKLVTIEELRKFYHDKIVKLMERIRKE